MNEIAKVLAIQAFTFFCIACFEACVGYIKQTNDRRPAVKSYLRFSGIFFVVSMVCSVISYLI